MEQYITRFYNNQDWHLSSLSIITSYCGDQAFLIMLVHRLSCFKHLFSALIIVTFLFKMNYKLHDSCFFSVLTKDTLNYFYVKETTQEPQKLLCHWILSSSKERGNYFLIGLIAVVDLRRLFNRSKTVGSTSQPSWT